jgi:integrase
VGGEVAVFGKRCGLAITAAAFVHLGKRAPQGQRVQQLDKAWGSACRRGGYTDTLLHDLRRSGVRAVVRSGVPESVAQRISGHATPALFRRYDITSDQDVRNAHDRRAQVGHNQAVKVVSIAR